MKIFVTGGRGYAGRYFIKDVIAKYDLDIVSAIRDKTPSRSKRLVEFRCDLSDIDSYGNLVLDCDYVIWFASNRRHFAPRSELYRDNVAPIQAITKFLKINGCGRIRRFFYISSISAREGELGFKDTSHLGTSYGVSKFEAESAITDSGLPVSILRLPFLYGPGFDRTSHLVFWKWLAFSGFSKAFDGGGSLGLLHLSDLSELLCRLIIGGGEKGFSQEIFEKLVLGDGVKYAFSDIAQSVSLVCWGQIGKRNSLIANFPWPFIKAYPLRRMAAKSDTLAYWSQLFSTDYFHVSPSLAVDYEYVELEAGLVSSYANE